MPGVNDTVQQWNATRFREFFEFADQQGLISGGDPVSASVDPSAAAPESPTFRTFAEAWAYLEGFEGFRVLTIVNDTTVEPGTYSGGAGLSIHGLVQRDVTLTVPEGVVFEGLRRFDDRINVVFTGATPPISDFEGGFDPMTGDVTPDIVAFDVGTRLDCIGSGPFLRVSGDGTPQSNVGGIIGRLTQDLGQDSTTPFLSVESGAVGFIILEGTSTIANGSLASDATSGIQLQYAAESNVSLDPADFPQALNLSIEANASAERVRNDSSVSGTNVTEALDNLADRVIRVPLDLVQWPGQQGANVDFNWGAFEQRNTRTGLLPGVVDGVSAVIRIPDNADITQPAVLQYEYVLGNDPAAGEVFIITYRALLSDEDRLNGSETPSTVDVDQIVVPANSDLRRRRRTVDLNITGAIAGDSMGVAIERLGDQDTYPSAFVILRSAYVEFVEQVP